VTTFDEDFTEEDMQDLLYWQAQDALKCSGCGGFTDETMQPGRDDDYAAELVVCHKCAAGNRADRQFRSDPHAVTDGLKVRVREVD
jgi:hypothetical protein